MEKEKRTKKEYKKIIWDTIFYLLFNKKKIAKQLEDFNNIFQDRDKYFRFGTVNDKNPGGYVVEIKIYE